jgi:hypothetical protein
VRAGQEGSPKGQLATPMPAASSRPSASSLAGWCGRRGCAKSDAVGEILHDQRDAGDQAGDETTTGQVVAAQQDVDRDGQRQRQQRAHQHRQKEWMGFAAPASSIAVLCRRDAGQTVEQRMRGERDHRQHGDFAERIKTAKIDQDDIDDVGAAPAGNRLLQIEARDGLERRARASAG